MGVVFDAKYVMSKLYESLISQKSLKFVNFDIPGSSLIEKMIRSLLKSIDTNCI